MSSVPKLFMTPPSPPVRAVQMCAKAIHLELEEKRVNLLKNEHLSKEFLKINPQHSLPTLLDNGFILWDSHAIMAYFISQYANDDALYPKEPKKRALVDQRLHFDSSNFWPHTMRIFKPIMLDGIQSTPKEYINDIQEDYKLIEIFLSKSKFIAGDTVTIADFSIVATITSTDTLVPIEKERFPKIVAWIKEMKKLPYYDVNQKGLDAFKEMFESRMNC